MTWGTGRKVTCWHCRGAGKTWRDVTDRKTGRVKQILERCKTCKGKGWRKT